MGTSLGFGAAKHRVVKAYGRDSFLLWMNPILSALEASLGLRIGLRSQAQVLDRMQRDVLKMERRGYRTVDSEELALPAFVPGAHATYYRATYKMGDGAHRSRGSDLPSGLPGDNQ